jgi:hydrogenase-4 component B
MPWPGSATGFANPARRVLASVLHTQAEVRPLAAAPDGGQEAAHPGQARPAAGDPEAALSSTGPRLGYTSDVVEVTETYLYRPVLRPVMALVRTAKRLQSGRLDAYLAYMLIALVALLALVTALA